MEFGPYNYCQQHLYAELSKLILYCHGCLRIIIMTLTVYISNDVVDIVYIKAKHRNTTKEL